MKYVQKPQQVTAFQFPEEARIIFDPDEMEENGDYKQSLLIGKGDWLVFLPTGGKIVLTNRDFVKQFTKTDGDSPALAPHIVQAKVPRATRKEKGKNKELVLSPNAVASQFNCCDPTCSNPYGCNQVKRCLERDLRADIKPAPVSIEEARP